MEQEKSVRDVKARSQVGGKPARSQTDACTDDGSGRSSAEGAVMVLERRAGVKRPEGVEPPLQRRSKSLPSGVKVYPITFLQVSRAYQRVKRSGGQAGGVDGQSLEDYAVDLQSNLYRLWNRLTSGSYHASPVREVEIPKADGGIRKLGIPTVEDRIAQQVIKSYLEPRLDHLFHPHSYGYRNGRSAKQALREVRRQCWRYDYCIDMDIRSFFDEVSHDLLLKAVRKHVSDKWVLRLIEQWLRAPIVEANGEWRMRIGRGTPQGGVISPLLSNLFLHYVLDAWLERTFTGLALIRYADDAVVCCRSAAQAELVLRKIGQRMTACGLRLHPVKTKIVFCKMSGRVQQSDYPVCFDFLGHRFQPRTKRNKTGKLFLSFDGAISPAAAKRITKVVRDSELTRRTQITLHQVAKLLNPKLRGWCNYYLELDKSEMQRVLHRVNFRIMRWGMRKYKRLRGSYRRACAWMKSVAAKAPGLFHHWQLGITHISKQTA